MANPITLQHQEDKLTFPPDSLLLLRILEPKVIERSNRDGTSKWEVLNVKFQIQHIIAIGGAGGDPQSVAPYQNRIGDEIYGSVKYYLSDKPDNPLRNWIEAILEIEGTLPLGFEFDPNMIAGRVVKGVTSQYNASTTDQNGVPYKRHEVKHLLKAGGMAVGNPQQQYAQQAPAQWGQPAQGQPPAQNGWGQPVQQQYQQGWGQEASAAQAQPQQPPAQNGWPSAQQQMDPWAPPAQPQQQGYPPQQQYAQPAQQAAAQQAQPQIPGQQVQPPAPVEDPWANYAEDPGF